MVVKTCWVMILCSLIGGRLHFRGICCLVASSSEVLVTTYETTVCHDTKTITNSETWPTSVQDCSKRNKTNQRAIETFTKSQFQLKKKNLTINFFLRNDFLCKSLHNSSHELPKILYLCQEYLKIGNIYNFKRTIPNTQVYRIHTSALKTLVLTLRLLMSYI
jgi:2-oxoglutarate dehydrogenase complex dehydrogenase (E1) component-like enzyme